MEDNWLKLIISGITSIFYLCFLVFKHRYPDRMIYDVLDIFDSLSPERRRRRTVECLACSREKNILKDLNLSPEEHLEERAFIENRRENDYSSHDHLSQTVIKV